MTKTSQWLLLATLFFFLTFTAAVLALLVKLPPGVIARGISLGPFDVGGLTLVRAEEIISGQIEAFENQGLALRFQDKTVDFLPVIHSATNPELSVVVYNFDVPESVSQAFALGREGDWLTRARMRLSLRFFSQRLPLAYFFNQELARQFLKENFSRFEKPACEARLQAVWQPAARIYEVEVVREEAGQVFDYDLILKEIKERLKDLNPLPYNLKLQAIQPRITAAEAINSKEQMEKILAKGDLILFLEEEKKMLTIPLARWSRWLEIQKMGEILTLGLNREAVSGDLKELVAAKVETEVKEAKFRMEDGKVVEFQPGQEGRLIDEAATLAEMERAIFGPDELGAKIIMTTISPQAEVAKINELGIKEIIGTGRSSFRGSPANRIHNIKVGAATLNGLLIAPGEIFSLLKALGEVNAERGYRPELVIKGNKTIPEFGGGLCQIGTTTFRVALASGLPILERQNHSYRVPYYEPPVGLDATIYNPRPDLKFLNDTGHYILIQTRVEGTDLIFDFWGTKDGRQIARTEPKVFNRSSPPSPKLIETLDLPVGKKKCTERAHAGADAVFTYTITYPDGVVKTQEFKSHYRPWGEVCLIGVEKLSEPAAVDNGEATSTLP